MAEQSLMRWDGPTADGWFLAWSLINWVLVIPALFANSFANNAG
jgi:hypothetical protein